MQFKSNIFSLLKPLVIFCFIGFYFSIFIIFLSSALPWFKQWPLIGYPMLFIPRWWILLWLIPILLLKPSEFLKQKTVFLLSLFLVVFYYINFQLPYSKLFSQTLHTDIRIMSANLGGHVKESYKLKVQIEYSKLGLIAFQETSKKFASILLPQGWNLECVEGNCVASKFPLKLINSLSRQTLGGWGNIASLFRIDIKGNDIYVLNVHLETARKGFENFQFSKLNFNALYENAEERYIEASIVNGWVAKTSPLIILGDFNMPVESAIYRQFFGKYQNAFNIAGFGLGYTKHTRLIGIRIDHILMDHHFSVVNSWVESDFGGDHRAILADLHLKILP